MGSAANIRAGKAYAELGIKDRTEAGLQAFKKRVMSAGTAVRNVGREMLAVGAVGAGGLAAAAATFAKMGGDMLELSQRTGIAVQTLTEYQYVLQQSNGDIESFEVGIKTMQKSLAGVSEDGQDAVGVFEELGLSVKELMALSPDQQFEAIADKIGAIENPAKRTEAAMKIFGKAGTKLIPVMLEGSASIRAMREEATKAGVTFDEKAAVAADKLGDDFGLLVLQTKMLAFQLGAALAPALTTMFKQAGQFITTAAAWVRENKGLVVTCAAVVVGVMAAGAALWGIGVTLQVLSMAAGVAGAALGLVFSPLGLIAGVAAILAYTVFGLVNGFDSLNQKGSEAVSNMAATVKTAFGGIADALQTGNIALAGKILWASLKQIFYQGMYEIMAVWRDWEAQVAESMDALFGRESKVQPRSKGELEDLKRLGEAQQELNALREEAAAGAAKAKEDRAASLSGVQQRIAASDVARTVSQAGSVGTFNSRAVSQIFGGANEYAKRTAEATEKIMLNTERTTRQLADTLAFV